MLYVPNRIKHICKVTACVALSLEFTCIQSLVQKLINVFMPRPIDASQNNKWKA